MKRSHVGEQKFAKKRHQLQQIVGLKGVTHAALAALLQATAEDENFPAFSNWQIKDFCKKEMAKVSYKLQLPMDDGTIFDWVICRPDNLIRYLAGESEEFRIALDDATKAAGSQPLQTIWYADEVVPGNILRPDNARKFWACYLGFKQMGPNRLSREQFWLPIAIIRTKVAASVVGGFSYCFRELLRCTLLEPCHLASVGVSVMLTGPTLIRIQIAHIIGDEAALKMIWDSKGASGLRPCFFCANVVAMRSNLQHNRLIHPSCSDPSKFQIIKDTDVWETFDKLKADHNRLRHGAFAILERASGLNYEPHGLLADMQLRDYVAPISVTTMDWFHNFLVNGIVNVEIANFLHRCRTQLGVTYKHLNTFCTADWRFPTNQQTHKVTDLFTSSREKASADTFKASASEVLLVFPLLREFVVSVIQPKGTLQQECKSLLSLFEVVDCMLHAKRGTCSDGIGLMRKFMENHKAAYELELMRPKHHYAFHNCLQMLQQGSIIDCFVHERKHQVVKRAASAVKNTTSFENSVLGQVLLEQTRQLQADIGDGLIGKVEQQPSLAKAFNAQIASVSQKLRFRGVVFGIGDVVVYNGQAAVIKACVESSGLYYFLAELFGSTGRCHTSSTWQRKVLLLCRPALLSLAIVKHGCVIHSICLFPLHS